MLIKIISSKHSPVQASLRYLPDLDCTILGCTGNDIVVVRTPGNVKHRTLVTSYQRHVGVESTRLGDRDDQKGSTSSGLDNDCQKLGVDTAECRVPGRLGDTDVVIALLSFPIGAKDVAKLALSHHSERHGDLFFFFSSGSCSRHYKKRLNLNITRAPYIDAEIDLESSVAGCFANGIAH